MADDIEAALNDWKKRIEAKTKEIDNTVDKGLLKAALYCEGQAKNIVSTTIYNGDPPFNDYNEDMWKRTGLLKASIGSGMNPSQDHSAIIYCSSYYGKFIEYGTGIYAQAGDGRKTPWVYISNTGVRMWTQGMRAKPFMYPAVFKNQEQIKEIIQSYVAKVVK